MIYIDTKSMSASFNFAVEEYICSVLKPDETVFLFWRTEPTLMIGNFQNTLAEINTEYVRDNKINVVRRRSGGGTIYTDEGGWQFSYWFPEAGHSDISFKQAGQTVVEALESIGAHVYYSDRNDILLDGKKISGNARYVVDGGMINHGSLLYDTNIDNMVRALTVSDEKLISKGIKSVRQRITNIKDCIDTDMTSEQFRDVMIKYICKDCDVYNLSSADLKHIEEIKKKYESWEWNYGNNPAYTLTKEKRFAGGKVSCCMNVNHGIIQQIKFYGDFFANNDLNLFENCLIGIKYEKNSIVNTLKESKIDLDKMLYMISAEELISLII